ncbi:hypothetical protein [Desulfitobacterium chlororespirans]|uniref:Uncharacterized protein n=1 Tax=Desulfitobacterium chlororespirans DSM 11544 TaxID=1121395 RepID=A0A1M7UUB8_9FIRM|nr:hypothetical protein [Desulfitobacterium chlororespirans]SHN86582.1 hypothetical protein SAMN02745215_04668 [Desulfitobacterium chlororespirans DSM 11544]
MKVIMDPIKMLAKFDLHGNLTPARFQHKDEVVDVERLLKVSEEKLAGNRMLIFRCQSEVYGIMKVFELKYELQTCKWFLYKM